MGQPTRLGAAHRPRYPEIATVVPGEGTQVVGGRLGEEQLHCCPPTLRVTTGNCHLMEPEVRGRHVETLKAPGEVGSWGSSHVIVQSRLCELQRRQQACLLLPRGSNPLAGIQRVAFWFLVTFNSVQTMPRQDVHGPSFLLLTLVILIKCFSVLARGVIWDWIILCCGCCPVHGGMVSSISDLHPADDSSSSSAQSCHQNVSSHGACPSGVGVAELPSVAGRWCSSARSAYTPWGIGGC